MKLAISNIAWDTSIEKEIASILKDLNVKGVEVAPTKINSNPKELTDRDIIKYREFWEGYGIKVVAMQALLFGRPELKIFENDLKRKDTFEYLKWIIRIGGLLDARVLVFGSPKNRDIGRLKREEAENIAVTFFQGIGDYSLKYNLKTCIEANPPEYGCNFITDTKEAFDLVQKVNNKGFGLHIDLGGMLLSGEDFKVLHNYRGKIEHVHISQPYLESLNGKNVAVYEKLVDTLEQNNYDHWISIEMKNSSNSQNDIKNVTKSITLLKSILV